MNFVLWQGIAALGCRPAIEDYRAEAHSSYGARVGGKRISSAVRSRLASGM
jgi:hypothetical protein